MMEEGSLNRLAVAAEIGYGTATHTSTPFPACTRRKSKCIVPAKITAAMDAAARDQGEEVSSPLLSGRPPPTAAHSAAAARNSEYAESELTSGNSMRLNAVSRSMTLHRTRSAK